MRRIVGIFIAPEGGDAMVELDRTVAIAGVGLAGDRYAKRIGFYSSVQTTPGAREVTLIREEDLQAVSQKSGIDIERGEHRRNLVTRGVDLDALFGRRFAVGGAVLEGVRACPPCNHLEDLTGKGLLKPMVRRGGLRARVVKGGSIQRNDAIVDLGPAEGVAEWGDA